ncbi:alkyl hydroperoxide reductase [Saccharothrix sp. ALI-22-I]|uniref:peroxiredoxin-like family protein n=1 Tax=Saccharothrix sp. ALI-22-I TaxID=1933778 RepID=UPI00097C2EC5|nr:peroxiredoxin-like family protein [Saccharothrix sp. ALI-22-I]ONI90413.1 alkyl hydroperoxide reductase [Saccharothrix sp. ALI-22-I]
MKIGAREWEAVSGETVRVPDPERLVHLQFRRFAGCPVCNLHLRSIVERQDEITAHGIVEVVVFHSSPAELRPHVVDFPLAVIGDPEKRLYVEFGVGSAPRALLDPRAWGPILLGLARDLGPVLRGRRPLPKPEGGRLGLPADFLIAPNGLVVAEKRGQHAFDQWSVDELLAHAQALTSKD